MQKKVIALAVAGLASGAAFAQSNVTIYGVADVGYEYADTGSASVSRIMSGGASGSRIGFKGEEALGNGLKAVFLLEQGFTLDNGLGTNHGSNTGTNISGAPSGAGVNNGTTLFQRQAYAGLNHAKLGTVTFGRQYTPQFYMKLKGDVFAIGTGGSINNYVAGALDRLDSSVVYVSPTFSGFSGMFAYSTGVENNTNTNGTAAATSAEDAGKAWSLGLAYDNGPIAVGYSYHAAKGVNSGATTGIVGGATVNSATGAAAAAASIIPVGTAVSAAMGAARNDVDDISTHFIGGSYDFKVVKLYANYGKTKTEKNTAVGSVDIADADSWGIGASMPFGAHTVKLSYGHRDDNTKAKADYTQWALGYNYTLSKRTDIYAAYADGKNDKCGTQNINHAINNGYGMSGSTVKAGCNAVGQGQDPSSFMVGLRHTF